jgi:hypothetical protein
MIDLVGKGTMRLMGNKDIKEREGVKLLGFHGELNGGEFLLRWS